MIDDAIASKERHDRFVRRVMTSRMVWGLKSTNGWACSASTADDAENKDVMPFWSDRAHAQQCAKEDWINYEPTSIPLDLFLEHWLPGMANDHCLVGTNWSAQLCGCEVEPLELTTILEK